MQVRGRLWEYSETVKMFRPHLLRFSSSLHSSSSLSVLTPKREMLLLESDGPWETFLTPLICVISCCFCCFFFSRILDVGEGISTSFCLSEGGEDSLLRFCFFCQKFQFSPAEFQIGFNLLLYTYSMWRLPKATVISPGVGNPMGFTISLIHSCYALHSFVHSCCLSVSPKLPTYHFLPCSLFFPSAGATCLNLFILTAALWQPESRGLLEFRAAPLIRPFNNLLHLLLSHQII